MTYVEWQHRRSRVSFLEPILRFFDVAVIGVVVGGSLVIWGSPGGVIFLVASNVWDAKSAETASLAGSLAQVTLTVWALLASLGGAVYMEASRTIRTDSRRNAEILNSGLPFLKKRGLSQRIPPDLRGQLVTVALDTPPLNPKSLTAKEAAVALAMNYQVVQDYWNRRSGYSVGTPLTWRGGERRKAELESRKVLLLRGLAIVLALIGVACYWFLGLQNVISPVLLLVALGVSYLGRNVLLDRSWEGR